MNADDRRRLLQVAGRRNPGVTGVTGVTTHLECRFVTPVTPVTPINWPHQYSLVSPCEPVDTRWSLDDWAAYFHERAAIREFSSGMTRSEAERLALGDVLMHWFLGRSNAVTGTEDDPEG
jgi:hypothetical protein